MKIILVLLLLLAAPKASNGDQARSLKSPERGAKADTAGRHLRRDALDLEKMVPQSLLVRGVYIPDERFNPFVDGVMINMVAEIRRKGLDPLYFRVTSEGTVEHVPTRGRRSVPLIGRRKDRQTPSAIGGGVIKGLSRIRRFGNAAAQIAGNVTLIRSQWLLGPLTVIVDYRGEPSITRVRTDLEAVQFDALTSIDRFGAEMEAFRLNSPLFEYMAYYGNRTLIQQKMTELVVKYLLSDSSFVSNSLEEAFRIASYDKIIPQFGADGNYYSVLQYLFDGKNGRDINGTLANKLLMRYKELSLPSVSGDEEPPITEEENDALLSHTKSEINFYNE